MAESRSQRLRSFVARRGKLAGPLLSLAAFLGIALVFEPPNIGLGFGDHLLEQLDHFRIVGEVDDLSNTLHSIPHAGNQVVSHLNAIVVRFSG
jgi:hypothetical protein